MEYAYPSGLTSGNSMMSTVSSVLLTCADENVFPPNCSPWFTAYALRRSLTNPGTTSARPHSRPCSLEVTSSIGRVEAEFDDKGSAWLLRLSLEAAGSTTSEHSAGYACDRFAMADSTSATL